MCALVIDRQQLMDERAEAQGRVVALREANTRMEEFLGIASEQRKAVPERIIDMSLPDVDQIPVMVDADRIGQVLTNYLTNALKYSETSAMQ